MLFGNNKACIVLGKGNIRRIKIFDGLERDVTDVIYIPELKRNLISLGILDKSGYTFNAEGVSLKYLKVL